MEVKQLRVLMSGQEVGTLAALRNGEIAFQYARPWIAEGFSISPFSLPLRDDVFIAKSHPFDGLFGIFDDSMPDGWGRLLVDRMLREKGLDPTQIHPLTRLSIVGSNGMGALEYVPETVLSESPTTMDLDQLAQECADVLANEPVVDLDELFILGGSSGGARPKAFISIDGEDWIVKFPSSYDDPDIGSAEYELALKAAQCGIEMPAVRLMPSNVSDGYFATKRFDRQQCEDGARKVHMASAGALLEASHRIPSLDYDGLLKLTLALTDSMEQVEKLFRLMVFNVYVGNRDDHAKNFSFLCSDSGVWTLSPGYDLTRNAGMNGEHMTTVNGKGRNITDDDIRAVGKRASLPTSTINSSIDQVRSVL